MVRVWRDCASGERGTAGNAGNAGTAGNSEAEASELPQKMPGLQEVFAVFQKDTRAPKVKNPGLACVLV